MGIMPDQPEREGHEQDFVLQDDESLPSLPAPLARMLDLEQERIAAQREQNEIALRGLEVLENSDRRQHELNVKQLETTDGQNQRLHQLARLVLTVFGGGFLVVLFFLLYMAFFGSSTQSVTALRVLSDGAKVLGGLLGGASIFYIVSNLARLPRR